MGPRVHDMLCSNLNMAIYSYSIDNPEDRSSGLSMVIARPVLDLEFLSYLMLLYSMTETFWIKIRRYW